jgi:hypothetical protein
LLLLWRHTPVLLLLLLKVKRFLLLLLLPLLSRWLKRG